jgi:hypothetical protein
VLSHVLLGGTGDQNASPELPTWEYSWGAVALMLRQVTAMSALLVSVTMEVPHTVTIAVRSRLLNRHVQFSFWKMGGNYCAEYLQA